MKSGSIIAFILLVVFLTPVLSMASEILIITNENVPISTLAKDDIKQIFLGKKTTWDNGEKIVFVVQDRTDTSDSFLKTYIRKSAYQYDIFWKKQVFTGKGKAPRSFSSDHELVQFVSQTPGAIGYVSYGSDTGKAKTVTVR